MNRTLLQLLKHKGEYSWQCDHAQLDSQETPLLYLLCQSFGQHFSLLQEPRQPGFLSLMSAGK